MIPSSWYGNPVERVPTWNYVAAYAWGTPIVFEDRKSVLDLLHEMTEIYQPEGSPMPLKPPSRLAEEKAGAVVGFEIEITRLEGKWKLSQDRTPEDRRRVRESLSRRGGSGDQAIRDLMAETEASAGRTT